MKLLTHRLQYPIHGLAVPAGAEHLLGDDGFIERVLLDDAPEMAEDVDIVVKATASSLERRFLISSILIAGA